MYGMMTQAKKKHPLGNADAHNYSNQPVQVITFNLKRVNLSICGYSCIVWHMVVYQYMFRQVQYHFILKLVHKYHEENTNLNCSCIYDMSQELTSSLASTERKRITFRHQPNMGVICKIFQTCIVLILCSMCTNIIYRNVANCSNDGNR